jgi:hypothetical protein
MSQYYDYLIQSRHEELIREAEKHRRSRMLRYDRTSRLRRRRRSLTS